MDSFFLDYKTIFIIIHLFGLAIGLGGALISDMLFFKFLKDLRLSEWELKTLDNISSMIWVGLLILLFSGAAIFATSPLTYLSSAKFVTKVIVIFVITLNGLILHFYVKPRLKTIVWNSGLDSKQRFMKRLAFACGSVSILSWTIATVLGVLDSIPFTHLTAIMLYVFTLVCVIITSQIFEYLFSKYFNAAS